MEPNLTMKKESSPSPRPLRLIIKKPVENAKVDAEDHNDESFEIAPNQVVSQTRESGQMQSDLGDPPTVVKKERSTSPRPSKKWRKRALHRPEVDVEDGGTESIGSTSNQLVLYNPGLDSTTQDIIPASDHCENHTSSFKSMMASNTTNKVLPSVGAFTVQCANCFKWRLIPTKEKYEEIREHILQKPFTCERARAWRPDITCDDPADISQDGSRLWAIDKPNIAQPPPGWERQLRIRGEGGTRFADVYYCAPSGKKLRSMVEIQKYLLEHPEYAEQGVRLSQFSFQIPRPLQENYVRKRPAPARVPNPLDGDFGLPRPLEPDEVNPLSWVEPTEEERPIPQYYTHYHDSPAYRHRHPHSESPPPPPSVSPSPPLKKKSSKPRIYIKNSSGSGSIVQPAAEEL